jgi:ribosomal protein S18 acetylase RimI-like enzyme
MSSLIVSTLKKDLPKVALCHILAFPNSIATALGYFYLRKMFSWYLSSNKTFLFHIENEQGQCTGYCGGMISDGTLSTGSASGMAQHSFYSAIWAFITHPWVIVHPEVRTKWPLLWKNIRMKFGLTSKLNVTDEQRLERSLDPQVGLVVIGVDPAYQSEGYGSLMLQEFERRALEEYGITRLQLTVRLDNNHAIKVYEKNGWKQNKTTQESLSMVKILIN